MRIQALIILILLGVQCSFAQGYGQSANRYVSPRLSPYDSVMLCRLPEININPVLKSSELPYFLDNSDLPYYRPIYKQVSSECGQVSGIAYNFTYEMNRLRDLPADDSANQYPRISLLIL